MDYEETDPYDDGWFDGYYDILFNPDAHGYVEGSIAYQEYQEGYNQGSSDC